MFFGSQKHLLLVLTCDWFPVHRYLIQQDHIVMSHYLVKHACIRNVWPLFLLPECECDLCCFSVLLFIDCSDSRLLSPHLFRRCPRLVVWCHLSLWHCPKHTETDLNVNTQTTKQQVVADVLLKPLPPTGTSILRNLQKVDCLLTIVLCTCHTTQDPLCSQTDWLTNWLLLLDDDTGDSTTWARVKWARSGSCEIFSPSMLLSLLWLKFSCHHYYAKSSLFHCLPLVVSWRCCCCCLSVKHVSPHTCASRCFLCAPDQRQVRTQTNNFFFQSYIICLWEVSEILMMMLLDWHLATSVVCERRQQEQPQLRWQHYLEHIARQNSHQFRATVFVSSRLLVYLPGGGRLLLCSTNASKQTDRQTLMTTTCGRSIEHIEAHDILDDKLSCCTWD